MEPFKYSVKQGEVKRKTDLCFQRTPARRYQAWSDACAASWALSQTKHDTRPLLKHCISNTNLRVYPLIEWWTPSPLHLFP